MPTSINEKRKSIANDSSEILEARVVANYGDPGLDEDKEFDILSRYLIVTLESSERIPTLNKWGKMLAIVARPQNLWIDLNGTDTGNSSTQSRSDAEGNISVGAADSFSISGIPRINNPYQLGELIKIKKIPNSLKMGNPIFNSGFSFANDTYNSWHTQGSSLPYFQNDQAKLNQLKSKTLMNPNSNNLKQYGFRLFKSQYEAFLLNYFTLNSSNVVGGITQIFGNNFGSSILVADGGYVFSNLNYIDFFAVEYEDININNKQRSPTSDCLPLIVTTPNSFPTPKTRAIGTISYNPTYSNIIKQ